MNLYFWIALFVIGIPCNIAGRVVYDALFKKNPTKEEPEIKIIGRKIFIIFPASWGIEDVLQFEKEYIDISHSSFSVYRK